MSNKRFDEYSAKPPTKSPENCSTCEHYYTGACDGLRGYCKNYKAYRAKTLEELVTVNIGTTVLFGGVIILLQILHFFF